MSQAASDILAGIASLLDSRYLTFLGINAPFPFSFSIQKAFKPRLMRSKLESLLQEASVTSFKGSGSSSQRMTVVPLSLEANLFCKTADKESF